MEIKFLKKVNQNPKGEIFISGSKSESNRLLILNALFDNSIEIKNLSNSEDTELLQNALKNSGNKIDIHHAGTAMRFLTAYLSTQENREVVLTGSARMKQRPIGILVDALNSLGAEISYLENEGFPSLSIIGKKLKKYFVELDANISSQYITALMLIAPKLENGLTIRLNGKITSLPYLLMTVELLERIGIQIERSENVFRIHPKNKIQYQEITVESDWSSASYFYSLAALSENPEIKINSYFQNSLQGDSALIEIYKNHFGIESEFIGNQIVLRKNLSLKLKTLNLNLNETPDIAQTIAVTCAGLKMKCKLTGLETLSIKETDRLTALKNELKKVGTKVQITKDSLEIIDFESINEIPHIETYNDHRMAMSFAPLCLLMDLQIKSPDVIKKSYPDFWSDLEKLTSV
ncbi:3-phosphoshikimate 1-carboxyvinyltransferase [Moheibacter sediminis]|uniref:3-phosphoshikimate 1-carboxyvinyltransferase n=1 Tax=Moheibacter sediminis TaxID=1434700 RepID=A0A1W2CU50_9FLAO|nr:3-phosphoshikimate 1-carboxyvinyltransferase [Moheibacter sediminis]SMC88769.1 3-phosphoshikimate 1-carboxyvinyltransferase [Moheibacter sediminis]